MTLSGPGPLFGHGDDALEVTRQLGDLGDGLPLVVPRIEG